MSRLGGKCLQGRARPVEDPRVSLRRDPRTCCLDSSSSLGGGLSTTQSGVFSSTAVRHLSASTQGQEQRGPQNVREKGRVVFAATDRLQREVVVQFPFTRMGFLHRGIMCVQAFAASSESAPRDGASGITSSMPASGDSPSKPEGKGSPTASSASSAGSARLAPSLLGTRHRTLVRRHQDPGQNAETVFCCGGSGDSHLGPEGPHVQ